MEKQDLSTIIYNLYPSRLYFKIKDVRNYIDFSVINGVKLGVNARVQDGERDYRVSGNLYIIDVITWLNEVTSSTTTGSIEHSVSFTMSSYGDSQTKVINLALIRDASDIWSLVVVVSGYEPIKIEFQGIARVEHCVNRSPIPRAKISATHMHSWINLLLQQLYIVMSIHASTKKRELPMRGQESTIG